MVKVSNKTNNKAITKTKMVKADKVKNKTNNKGIAKTKMVKADKVKSKTNSRVIIKTKMVKADKVKSKTNNKAITKTKMVKGDKVKNKTNSRVIIKTRTKMVKADKVKSKTNNKGIAKTKMVKDNNKVIKIKDSSKDLAKVKMGNQAKISGQFPDTRQFELPDTDIYRPKMTEERAKELLEKAESIRELKRKAEENGIKANDLPDHEQDNEYGNAPQKVKGGNSNKDGNNQNDSLENYLPQNDSPTLIDIDDMIKLTPDNMRAARFYREGNWDEYQRYVAQFKNEIAVAKKIIKEIIKQNKFDSIKRGKEHTKEKMTQLPVQGGKTIDLQRHVELQKKLRRNDPNITKKDLERFRTKYKYSEDELIKEVQLPQSNFGILIDGSGSMTGRPFESALAISCILYEAARSFKEINVYIYMMGQPYPLTVAKPDNKTKEIGKNIESVREGQGGANDYLIPAVQQFLKDVSEDMGKHPHVKSGFTHIFSITDGGNDDYFDGNMVNDCLRTMLEKNEQLTFDSFFMGNEASGGGGGYTKPLIHEMQKEGCMRIDYVDGIERGEQIPEKIMEMLKKRLKHSTIKEPMTNSVKEKLIIETLKSMKKR